jgi:general secretion pathway protein M
MKEWFNGLEARERWLVMAATALLAVLLVYVALWEPLRQKVEELRSGTGELQLTLYWMQQASQEVKQLRGTGGVRARADGQSLLGLIDRSAKSGGLGTALKRVQPDGDQRVRVWLEGAGFDELVRWLAGLEDRQGVGVVNSVFEAKDESGRVDARLVFEAAT